MIEKPDGRWALLIVFAAASIRIILYGITQSSGVVYMVILDVFQRSKGETSWITSVITAVTFSTCKLFNSILYFKITWFNWACGKRVVPDASQHNHV